MRMRLSDITRTLREEGIHLSKALGQNFLVDRNIARKIASLAKGRPVFEIGPGAGHLTVQLAEYALQVVSLEIDSRLLPLLRKTTQELEKVRIIEGDALQTDFQSLLGSHIHWITISNLPYSSGQEIIFRLLDSIDLFEELILTLQKEVGERLMAPPGGKEYGRLSVAVQRLCNVERIFDIPPQAFFPRPEVMSTVLRLTPHSLYPLNPPHLARFERLVKIAFSKRRKTLRNNLKDLGPEESVRNALELAGIDPGRRAESLSVEEYMRLLDTMTTKNLI